MAFYTEKFYKTVFFESRHQLNSRINSLLETHGKTASELAEMTETFGFPRPTVYRWLSQGFPKTDRAFKFARLLPGWFDIPAVWFFCGTDYNHPASPIEIEINATVAKLTRENQCTVLRIATALHKADQWDQSNEEPLNWEQ
jgi:hypothetical protein